MRKIDSISDTGLVLFVDESKRGGTDFGTESDCLAYAYKYRSGKCFAYSQSRRSEYDRGKSTGNNKGLNNYALGRANDVKTGVDSVVLGQGHKVAKNGSNVVLKGRNGYAENYGENVYSVSRIKDRARYVEIHYVGTTSDDNATELFIGGRNSNRFRPNPDYASCYFVEYYATALNAVSGEIWTEQNYKAFRNITGSFVEVGNHSSVVLRDSNLDYDITITPQTNPSYLKIDVTGEANHDVVWNVVLQITEVRIEENLSANLIQNGDFSEIGDELVNILNAQGSLTRWVNRTEFGVDFVGGNQSAVRYLSDIPSAITTNKIYRISVDVQNFVGQNQTGVSSFGRSTTIGTPYLSSNGNILIYAKSSNGSLFRYYGRETQHTFELRNFSIKQLDPNSRWNIQTTTATNGWIFYDNRIRGIANGHDNFLQQNFSAKIGSRYQIKYTVVTSTINGTIILSSNGVFGSTSLDKTVGTHTLILEATNSARLYDLRFVLQANNGSGFIELTDISVKELTYGV